MSSGDDSETAEWEREQMLRGTQSQARHQKQSAFRNHKSTASDTLQPDQKLDAINADLAKQHVQSDIEQVERDIEATKRNIGSTGREIFRAKQRLEAMHKQIEKLEASNKLFDELEKQSGPSQLLDLIERHKQVVNGLPEDQRALIVSLTNRLSQPD